MSPTGNKTGNIMQVLHSHDRVLMSGHWWVAGFETVIEENKAENAQGSSCQSTCTDFKGNNLQQAGLRGAQEA